jgi:hypothetical protein
MMNRLMGNLLMLCCVLLCSMAFAHGDKPQHDMTPPDSLAISVAIDSAGKLWRVGVSDGFVEVASSTDLGKTFTKPLRANTEKQTINAHGEVRPKIAIGKKGEVYVTWMQNLAPRFSSYIWFARLLEGRNRFEKPQIVHTDRAEIGHAFEEINVAPNGDITVLWLDARVLAAAKKLGQKHAGSSIYYAVSVDAGKTFAPEQKLADNSCECCRVATTAKPDGTVVAMWRHVFEGSERDHNIAEIPKEGAKPEPHRATFGRWVIDGCPHHGAALASGGEGKDWWGYHMAYFDGNEQKSGLYYSRMDGLAWASSPAKKFGDSSKQAGHPAILSSGQKAGEEHVWLVWREKNDGKTSILGMHSEDGGKSWDEAKTLANTSAKADYPILIQHKTQAYIVWNTQAEGLQVIALGK